MLGRIMPHKFMDKKKPQSKYALALPSGGLAQDAIDMKYTADVLPAALKEAYDQSRNTKLESEISKKRNDVMGGAIEGLNKYKDISDPFARRALAEKYQSGLSVGLDALVTEKERRQKSFTDYVNKWSGLFGAEAARKQAMASEALEREKMAISNGKPSKDTDNDYLEYAGAQLEASKGMNKGQYHADTLKELLIKAPNESTRTAVRELFGGGVDKEGQESLGINRYKPEAVKTETPKQAYENSKYSQLSNAAKSREEAVEGGLYWKDGKLYKKVSHWYGNADVEVEQ